MKKILTMFLMRLLEKSIGMDIDYTKIDKKAVEDWAYKSFDDKGWRSYFAYEDMKILKEMSFGKDTFSYNLLVGRRLQLLYLFDEMKKSYENKKSEIEKKRSEKSNKKNE